MPKYRIWLHETETSYIEVDADNEEHALKLIENNNNIGHWIGTRYDAEYDAEAIADAPFITEQRASGNA
jgi:hypothetical protein